MPRCTRNWVVSRSCFPIPIRDWAKEFLPLLWRQAPGPLPPLSQPRFRSPVAPLQSERGALNLLPVGSINDDLYGTLFSTCCELGLKVLKNVSPKPLQTRGVDRQVLLADLVSQKPALLLGILKAPATRMDAKCERAFCESLSLIQRFLSTRDST